ncbi:MAG: hypothetical protein ACRCYS_07620 [Beijerinckiaceae bacterium]
MDDRFHIINQLEDKMNCKCISDYTLLDLEKIISSLLFLSDELHLKSASDLNLNGVDIIEFFRTHVANANSRISSALHDLYAIERKAPQSQQEELLLSKVTEAKSEFERVVLLKNLKRLRCRNES